RAEFLRRWEAHPEINKAELIGGTVFMPSPLSVEHAVMDSDVGGYGYSPTGRLLYAAGVWGQLPYRGQILGGRPRLLVEICGESPSADHRHPPVPCSGCVPATAFPCRCRLARTASSRDPDIFGKSGIGH